MRAPSAWGSFLCVLALASGCASGPSAEEREAARNTFACQLAGERLVVRFELDEARMLMPGGERVTLYRLPTASGVRYSNGTLELRGSGTDLVLTRDGERRPLEGCAPYALPAKK